MNWLKVNFENKNTILSSFDNIADKLFSSIILQVNEAKYRITHVEFYAYSEGLYEDPYTNKHPLQKNTGKIYLHGSGMDITCGSDENYCGILIRGVAKIYDGATNETAFIKRQIDGPLNVTTEIFSNIDLLSEAAATGIKLIDIEYQNQDSLYCLPKHILKTTRVGLTAKCDSISDAFRDSSLRYLLFTPKYQMKYRGIEKIVLENLSSGVINREHAGEILSYNLKKLKKAKS